MALAEIGLYFWGLFKTWITILFVTPYQHADMLWLLVPIWITWFFAEFFQEKQGTSMGNAITNSVVVIWGSIDCSRQTVRLISEGAIPSLTDIILRFLIISLILGYGVMIVVLGLRGNMIIKYIGRVREVTYAFAMFAPVFYNAVPLSINHVISAILFFPVFYFAIELLDRYTPNPKAMVEDMQSKGKSAGFGSEAPAEKEDLSFDKGLGKDMGGGFPSAGKSDDLGGRKL
jgi:hypothetical protein